MDSKIQNSKFKTQGRGKEETRGQKPEARDAGSAISRMPRAVREQVSRCLEDGGDWRAVKKICEAAGFPGVRAQNVTNFRKGAHKEWIAKEERIESLRRDSEATAAVMRHYSENGGSPAEAGLLAGAEMMCAALASLGPETYKSLLADDPKAAFQMMKELDRVAKLITAKQTLAAATPVQANTPAMTPEDRTRALKEIFGLP